MNVYWVWVVVPAYVLLAWVATIWIRARHAAPSSPMDQRIFSAPDPLRRLAMAVEQRDLKIAQLEARVEVLERIVTDGAADLRREFQRL